MLSCITICLIVIIFIGIERNIEKNVHKKMNETWDTCSDSLILTIQKIGQCCGFSNYKDRIQEPCELFDPEIGCYEGIMKPMYRSVFKSMNTLFIITTIISCVTLIFEIGHLHNIAKKRGQREESRRPGKSDPKLANFMTSPIEPFDNWHRAVLNK